MMDLNPKARITARQLVAFSDIEAWCYFFSINEKSCSECHLGTNSNDPNLPLDSRFKDTNDMKYPKRGHPEEALNIDHMPDWEAAKREWPQEHMWL